ncbi:zf-HC2 domain-containing protein [Thermorudis peleae]|uniref:zf-HC2 domain-containing protein n=1 Tax=Thermorudis peleae TaxID=1382356 RepID=UPI000571DBF6|nr:zf-HC2 domain-containing protein [Thermorudis peleae]
MTSRACKSIRPLLSAYMDGELSPDDVARLQAHLAECADCRALLASYERMREQLHQLPTAPVPPTLHHEIRAAIEREQRRPRWLRLSVSPVAFAFALGLILMLLGTLLYAQALPPSIVSSEPAANATWPFYRPVTITFTKPMDEASVASHLRISPAGERERLPISWRGTTLVIGASSEQQASLLPDTIYTIAILHGARDRWGHELQQDWTLTFRTTSAIASAPTATSTPAPTETPAATTPQPSATANTTATPPPAASTATAVPPTAVAAASSPAPANPTPAPQQGHGQSAGSAAAPSPATTAQPPRSSSAGGTGTAGNSVPTSSAGSGTTAPAPAAATPPASPTPTPLSQPTATPSVVPSPTAPAAATPATTPTPQETPAPAATSTPAASPTPTPQPTPVTGAFAQVYWGDQQVQKLLGSPTGLAYTVAASELAFQRGVMLERIDTNTFYILKDDGSWVSLPAPTEQGDPASQAQPNLWIPGGKYGLVWKQQQLLDSIGYATEATPHVMAQGARVQPFEHGILILSDRGFVYMLLESGSWAQFPVASS